MFHVNIFGSRSSFAVNRVALGELFCAQRRAIRESAPGSPRLLYLIFYLGACAPGRGAPGYKFLRGGTLFIEVGASERRQDEFDETHDRSDRQ